MTRLDSTKESLRICILACVFWPIYPGYGGRQALVLAETLIKAGCKVDVVTTFPVEPSRHLLKPRLFLKEYRGEIRIFRVFSLVPNGPGLWRKLLFYLSFMFSPLIALPFIRRPDVILGLDPPAPFLMLPGFLFSRILMSKYVIRVTDLWPDILFYDYGIIKSGIAKKLATLVTTIAYKLADHIMAFTPKIKPGIMKYDIPDGKISVIEIAIDTLLFHPIPVTKSEAVGLGIPSLDAKFIALYSGAFASTYDFDTFLEAAKNLERFDDILFILLGDGDSKNHIKRKISELELSNVMMLPPVSQAELVAKYINCSNVCVVPLKPEMVFGMDTRPSKTFEFWACGKPIITCSEGELPALIEESQAGIALEPGKPIALTEAIKFLFLNRDVAVEMGKRGREFVLAHFSYKVLEANLRRMLEQVVS